MEPVAAPDGRRGLEIRPRRLSPMRSASLELIRSARRPTSHLWMYARDAASCELRGHRRPFAVVGSLGRLATPTTAIDARHTPRGALDA